MHNRTKMIAAAAAVAAAIAAGSTAAAVASTSPKPGAHAKTVSASGKPVADGDLGARLGVTPARLDQALRAVKTSLGKTGNTPTADQFDATLARILGIPQARVRQAFPAEQPARSKAAGSKAAVPPGNEALTAAVASALHVSTARVNAALPPLYAAGEADPPAPVFAAGPPCAPRRLPPP